MEGSIQLRLGIGEASYKVRGLTVKEQTGFRKVKTGMFESGESVAQLKNQQK